VLTVQNKFIRCCIYAINCIFIVSMYGCSNIENKDTKKHLSDIDALCIVTNRNSKEVDLVNAITTLENRRLDKTLWIQVGSDTNFIPDHRRRCIQHIIKRTDWRGRELVEFGRIVKETMTVDREGIEQIHNLIGWMPINWDLQKESLFCCRVLGKYNGQYDLTVFITIGSQIDEDTFASILIGSNESDVTINNITTWDSDDSKRLWGQGFHKDGPK
jgi:hypothetical protein